MKDNFSKRRFYLNKKEKINSKNENITKEKDVHSNFKYDFNNNKEKDINLEKNAYKLNRERKNIKNEVDKQKAVKNFILFSNEIESNNNQKEINKNYFNFTRPNKIFFNPNDYINMK